MRHSARCVLCCARVWILEWNSWPSSGIRVIWRGGRPAQGEVLDEPVILSVFRRLPTCFERGALDLHGVR